MFETRNPSALQSPALQARADSESAGAVSPKSFTVLLGADGYPHPGLAAYAHLTHSLEGKPFVRKVALGENRFAYLFAGRNGTCAVLCGGRDARLPLIQDPAIRWTDLYGNPLADSAVLPGTMRYAESALSPEELETRLTHP